ncbi:MAG: LysR family transcriptional regulator [Aggregatilineales bacterium]
MRIFAVVVQEGSFSAAAQRLYLTQPAISQHIADLEARLGISLFVRGRRGVILTPQGQVLYRYAEQIFSLIAEAERAVMNADGLAEGQLIIGATPGAGAYLLPEWVRAFRARYPVILVTIQTAVTGHIIRDLKAQRLDLGIVEGEIKAHQVRGLTVIPFQKVEQYIVVGPQHPWRGRASIPITALIDQPIVMRPQGSQTRLWLEKSLRRLGLSAQIEAEYDNLESIKRAVAGGKGVAILPDYAVQQETAHGALWRISIEGAPLMRTLKLLHPRTTHMSATASAFLKVLEAHYPVLSL